MCEKCKVRLALQLPLLPLRQQLLKKHDTVLSELASILIDLLLALQRLLEYVLFEVAGSLNAIWEDHHTNAVLDALDPHAHVYTFIHPSHYSIAVSFILEVVTLVAVARLPLEDTITVLLVMLVHTFV